MDQLLTAVAIGIVVGFTCPLFSRSVSTALGDVLAGVFGACLGLALNLLLFHANAELIELACAMLLIAVLLSIPWRRSSPPAQ